ERPLDRVVRVADRRAVLGEVVEHRPAAEGEPGGPQPDAGGRARQRRRGAAAQREYLPGARVEHAEAVTAQLDQPTVTLGARGREVELDSAAVLADGLDGGGDRR